MTLKSSALVVAAFATCLALAAAVHAQTNPTGRLDPSDAAQQGDAEAQYGVGQKYDYGLGVEQDHAEAVRWYRLAAEQGHAGAQYGLAFCYRSGRGVEQDDAEAVRWYRLAAEQGHAGAQYSLALHYGLGRGVEQDDAEAVRWHRLAAKQGHAGAQFLLGSRYEVGDFTEAVRWYRLAAGNGDDEAKERLESLEKWRCFDEADFSRTNVLFTLSRLVNGGDVSVAGTSHPAAFEVQGLNRRWDFGLDDDGSSDYMFLIEPDGTGFYYDFSRSTDGTASPSQRFKCEVAADR